MPASTNVNEAERGKDCCQRRGLDPEGVASDNVQDMHSWAVRMQRAMTKRQESYESLSSVILTALQQKKMTLATHCIKSKRVLSNKKQKDEATVFYFFFWGGGGGGAGGGGR